MAVTKTNQKQAVRVDYKPSYDTTGELDLAAYSQTFTQINSTATMAQIKAYVDGLMSLTVYGMAPYKIELVETSMIVVA